MSLTLTRATKVVPLCVNANLRADHDRAVQHLDEVRRVDAADPRENSTAVREAAEAVQAIEREMREHTVSFTLQALPRKKWAEFTAAHPPRPDNETDKLVDVDQSALDGAIVQMITEVKAHDGSDVPFTPAEDWVPLADEMSDGQWTQFALVVLALNNSSPAAPFSPAASLAIQRSEQTLKRPSA